MLEFDFVIVGAGSAGCVLANRLSADRRNSVLLLEAGPDNRNQLYRIPLLGPALGVGHPKHDWNYKTEPTKDGRAGQDWPRGRMLGGTSRLNGMVYVRGAKSDYDGWAAMGCEGWSWNEVEPHFRKLEGICEPDNIHGANGPLAIHRLRRPHPLARSFIKAHSELSLEENETYNTGHQEGASILVSSNDGHWRSDGVASYLNLARRRPNLTVLSDALADQLTFDGLRCSGVKFSTGGTIRIARARREVIVSAGTIATPALLMRSGIGPAGDLKDLGIPVILDSPNVGENLHEHPAIQIVARSKTRTISSQNKLWHLPGHLYDWWARRGGLLSAASYEAISFVRSHRDKEKPDIQMHFAPYGLERSEAGLGPSQIDSFMIQTNLSYPKSRGRISLQDRDPETSPIITHDMFSQPEDLERLCDATRIALELFESPAFAAHYDEVLLPEGLTSQQEELAQIIRAHAVPAYHPAGTCSMGAETNSPLSPELGLRGVDGIRVVDASVIPAPISGNIQATVMMIAEKAASHILEQEGGSF